MLLNLLYVLGALLLLSFIVTVHEFGHYLAGRLCGIGIVEFSVGFGPRLLGFSRKGIDYSLRAIPLGGFCKFVGEDEENPDPRAMNNQPVWKRIVTVAAGPFMNFVLAFVVAVAIFAGFEGTPLPRFEDIVAGSPAAEAGLRAGDLVTAVDGQAVPYDESGAAQLRQAVQSAEGRPLRLTVQRGGETLEVELAPEETLLEGGVRAYQIGVYFAIRRYSVFQAVPMSLSFIRENSTMMLGFLRRLVFRGEGARDVMGPIGIVSEFSTLARQGWYMIFLYAFVITLNLGIMNLLPLPALDGGRLVFLIIEAVRRKPLPPEKEGLVHGVGFLLIIGLFVAVAYQDIVRLIRG